MKYTAKSHIALNVLVNGKSMHISFTQQTGGGSVYYTNDADIAHSLERHPKFNKLFKKEAEAPVLAVAKPKEAPKKVEEAKPKEKEKTFACYEDAKDYLVDTFGVSRTKLRSKTAIEAAAKANNIILKIEE